METYKLCKRCNKYKSESYEWYCIDCIQEYGSIELFELLDWFRNLTKIHRDINRSKIDRDKSGKTAYNVYKKYKIYLILYYDRMIKDMEEI